MSSSPWPARRSRVAAAVARDHRELLARLDSLEAKIGLLLVANSPAVTAFDVQTSVQESTADAGGYAELQFSSPQSAADVENRLLVTSGAGPQA